MFLPEKTPARIFICYPPGARGDFLAAILNDTIADNYDKPTVFAPPDYQKTHWIKEIIGNSLDRFEVRIRIRLTDLGDFLDVTHLHSIKLKPTSHNVGYWINDPKVRYLKQLLENEEIAKSFDPSFDYIVDFKSLFKIKQIGKLYKKINNRELDDATIECIKHNISLQPRLTYV